MTAADEKKLLTRISLNPGVLAGKPIIRGMRISAQQLVEMQGAGMSEQDILESFPYLEADDLRAALVYAAKVLKREPVVLAGSTDSEMTSHQVSVAAEAHAACLFAHAGCDLSVQYGANQPGHDLVAIRGKAAIKISVKGSQDGGWGLVQSYKAGRSYRECVEKWASVQNPEIIFCLVQFQGVRVYEPPRAYLASPAEIAAQLIASRAEHGSTILHEYYAYQKGAGAGTIDELPYEWRATKHRIVSLFT